MITHAEVLTSEGRGAVAVVRVVGRRALEVVEKLFRPSFSRSLRESGVNRPRLGRFGGEHGDEVVVIPTNEDSGVIEIHGHGGSAAVLSLLDALESLGVFRVPIEGAGPIDDPSRWSSLAAHALPNAPTLRVAEILLDQQAGALDGAFRRIEAESRKDPGLAINDLFDLRGRSSYGLRMVKGWKVALAGRPNVGKSSLLNRLAGYRRSVVSEEAGTTRDVVAVRTALDGWPIEFLDMAGLRDSEDVLETKGVERALKHLGEADLILVILDRSRCVGPEDHHVLDAFPKAIRVANKCDLVAAWDEQTLSAHRVSASTGEGIDELCAEVVRLLVPIPPEPGQAVPFAEEAMAEIEARLGRLGVR